MTEIFTSLIGCRQAGGMGIDQITTPCGDSIGHVLRKLLALASFAFVFMIDCIVSEQKAPGGVKGWLGIRSA